MSYCTVNYMRALLPKSITIGDTNVTTPVLNKPGASNTIDTRTAQLFINFASQEIDSRLSTVYVVPLKRIKTYEDLIPSDVKAGSTTIPVNDNGPFRAGELIRIGDLHNSELNEVNLIPDDLSTISSISVINAVKRNYTTGNESIVSVVSYPDPIPLVCARIAVAAVIDKMFVAEQNPDVSNYGKSQRTLASTVLDELMAGSVRLNGQDFVGRRFVRMQLRDTMNTSAEIQRGGGKEV
jgi:hypothetical protein